MTENMLRIDGCPDVFCMILDKEKLQDKEWGAFFQHWIANEGAILKRWNRLIEMPLWERILLTKKTPTNSFQIDGQLPMRLGLKMPAMLQSNVLLEDLLT